MGRKKTADPQLAIEWTEAMRWEDLPAPLQERVRERLAELLRRAAGPPPGPREERDHAE